MARHSTAGSDATTQRDGTTSRGRDTGRSIPLLLIVGVYALSGAMYLLVGNSMTHSGGETVAMLAGFGLLVIAGGLWFRQKWAIVVAIVLQGLELLLAYVVVDFLGVVLSIVFLGTLFAIPHRTW